MSKFLGGSAYAMARDIGEGYHVVSDRTFKGMATAELGKLAFELDRALRDARGEQPSLDDLNAVKKRNRKIQRLNQALTVLRAHKMRHRK